MSTSAAPRISIGLPARNAEKWLADAVTSIQAQTVDDFELIISDNASTDRTAEIAEAFAAQDRRIRVVRQPANRGAAWNFAFVLAQARAPYFKWMGADDTIAPTFLERTLAALEAQPQAVLAYPQSVNLHYPEEFLFNYQDVMPLGQASAAARFAEHRRRVTTAPLNGSHPLSNVIHGLVRTAVLRKTAGLAPYVGSDVVLLGELALRGTIVEVPERLMAMRQNGGSPWAHDGTAYDVAVWLDPANAGRLSAYAPTWAVTKGYLDAIRRAPLTPEDRRAAALALLRSTPRAPLAREAVILATRFTGARPWNAGSGRRFGPPRAAGA